MEAITLRKIKILEMLSTILATAAYPLALLLATGKNRIIVILAIGGIGLILQPFIYFAYKNLNKTELFKQQRFWPITLGLLLIFFFSLRRFLI
jgi:hypothetical protein